jgi:hypothetical protein
MAGVAKMQATRCYFLTELCHPYAAASSPAPAPRLYAKLQRQFG